MGGYFYPMASVCLHGAVLWCSEASWIMKHENHIFISLHYLKVCIRYQVLWQIKWENDYRLGSTGNKMIVASLKEPSQHLPGITKVITTNLSQSPLCEPNISRIQVRWLAFSSSCSLASMYLNASPHYKSLDNKNYQ
jgi:hypothetical protein